MTRGGVSSLNFHAEASEGPATRGRRTAIGDLHYRTDHICIADSKFSTFHPFFLCTREGVVHHVKGCICPIRIEEVNIRIKLKPRIL